jgi:hypothetical protein
MTHDRKYYSDYHKAYREANREAILKHFEEVVKPRWAEKVTCDVCKCEFRKQHEPYHMGSKKHARNIEKRARRETPREPIDEKLI